jgi:hypothetical protein
MRRIVTVSLVALLLAGCGPKRGKTGVVTGKITYQGKPVNGALLLLYPAAGGQTPSMNVPVTQEGEFRISDLQQPGEYKVVVQGTAGAQQASAASLKNMPPDKAAEAKEKLKAMSTPPTIPFPNKYKDPRTTDLKVTITDKDQAQDLELTGPPPPAGSAPPKEL